MKTADQILEEHKNIPDNKVALWVVCLRWARANNKLIQNIFAENPKSENWSDRVTPEFLKLYEEWINSW